MVRTLKRLKDFFTNGVYRRVLLVRVALRLLRMVDQKIAFVGIQHEGETTFLFADDVVITPYTVATGGFQRDDFFNVLTLLGRLNYKLGGVFLDVGANIGTQTVYALGSGSFASAACFEPAATNVALLRANLAVNGMTERADVIQAGVSDHSGQAALAFSPNNSGDHRIASGVASAAGPTVALTSLDDYLAGSAAGASAVSLVWIDTQGHEAEVMAGATSLTGRDIPVVMEFWPGELKRKGTLPSLIASLQRSYTSFYDLRDPALRPKKIAELSDYARHFPSHHDHTDLLLVQRP